MLFINKLLHFSLEEKWIRINNRKLLMQNDVVQEFDSKQFILLADIFSVTQLILS